MPEQVPQTFGSTIRLANRFAESDICQITRSHLRFGCAQDGGQCREIYWSHDLTCPVSTGQLAAGGSRGSASGLRPDLRRCHAAALRSSRRRGARFGPAEPRGRCLSGRAGTSRTAPQRACQGESGPFCDQDSVSADAECCVVVQVSPAPALEVAEPDLLFQFEIVGFDPPLDFR